MLSLFFSSTSLLLLASHQRSHLSISSKVPSLGISPRVSWSWHLTKDPLLGLSPSDFLSKWLLSQLSVCWNFCFSSTQLWYHVNISKSHPVSVSLIFQSNLNAKLSFSTVSAYAIVVFQHLLQPCFSIYYSSVSASTTAVFQHLLQQCFNIYYSSVSTSITAVFQHILSTVFQLMLQPGVSA